MSDISDDNLEQLLRQAAPRPEPDAAATAAARAAVRAEWQRETAIGRHRRHATWFALAASVSLAVFLAFNQMRPGMTPAIDVATIDKVAGAVYTLGERAQLTPVSAGDTLPSGAALVTGPDAAIALAWHDGGSLRLGASGELRFVDAGNVSLRRGPLYFDSHYAVDPADAPTLAVHTDYGKVEHLGTQYLLNVDSGSLTVSVREGRVQVSGGRRPHTIETGTRARFAGRGAPTTVDIDGHAPEWAWLTTVSPAWSADGRTIAEFLGWATRELGYTLEYAGPAARDFAGRERLSGRGTLDTLPPAAALAARMATTGMAWHIDGGTLYVDTPD